MRRLGGQLDRRLGSVPVGLGGSRRGFSPKQIVGLALHLDAAKITGLAAGDPVGTWSDLSGNGNTATQATAAKQPSYQANVLNGKPVVRFDGVDDYFDLTIFLSISSITVFAVLKQTSGISVKAIVAGNTASFEYRLTDTHKQESLKTNTASMGVSTTALSTTAFSSVNVTYDGANGSYRLNGADDGSFASAQSFTDSLRYVGSNSGTGEFFAGDIAELLLYTSALDVTERGKVEGYLKKKWGTP